MELKVKTQQAPQYRRHRTKQRDGSLTIRAEGGGDGLVVKTLVMEGKYEVRVLIPRNLHTGWVCRLHSQSKLVSKPGHVSRLWG